MCLIFPKAMPEIRIVPCDAENCEIEFYHCFRGSINFLALNFWSGQYITVPL